MSITFNPNQQSISNLYNRTPNNFLSLLNQTLPINSDPRNRSQSLENKQLKQNYDSPAHKIPI